jgi:hypothetical protein
MVIADIYLFMVCLIAGLLSNYGNIVLNYRMISVNNELERMWKEAVMV